MAALRSKKEIEPGNDMLNFTQNGPGITSITDKLEHVSIWVVRSAILLYEPSTCKTIWITKFVNWMVAKLSGGSSFLVFDF